jgi:anti-sigma B factor antagonist
MSAEIRVFRPVGILDSINGAELRQTVIDAIQSGDRTILINCEAITFMDSSGLGTIVLLLKKVREIGGQFAICSINEQVNMLLELTNTNSVLNVYSNQAEFQKACESLTL